MITPPAGGVPPERLTVNPDLRKRVQSALLPSAVVILAIFVLGHETIFLLSLGAALMGWREYSRMMGLNKRLSFHSSGFVLLTLMFCYSFFVSTITLFWVWLIWVTAFFILFIEPWFNRQLSLPEESQNAERDWAHLCRFLMGLLYIYLIFGFIAPIAGKPQGEQLLFLGLATVFGGDIAAYFVGRAWGRRKLWPALSPQKSIEGALGGWLGSFLATLLVAFLFKATHHNPLNLGTCAAVGLLAPPLAQAGDFLESLMKRAAGFKDSGTLLPGHGGLLDRVDGLVFVLPILYYLF